MKRPNQFNYLYKRDYQAWLVLDPVITIRPEQVFKKVVASQNDVLKQISTKLKKFFGKRH